MNVNGRNQAFPVPGYQSHNNYGGIDHHSSEPGMTKREVIAKDLLTGILSNPACVGMSEDDKAATAISMTDRLLDMLEKTDRVTEKMIDL